MKIPANRLLTSVIALSLLLILPASAIAAQRTFVSAGTGSDTNACTRQLPCRNFPAAITLTDTGGEVVVLDSGGYGAVTITKGVQLLSPAGIHAAITAFTGDGITVTAPGYFVRIRGLKLTSSGALNGIRVTSAGSVDVEDVSTTDFQGDGLLFASSGHLVVKNSSFWNSDYGVEVNPSTTCTAGFDNVSIEKTATYGLFVSGAKVTVKNSTVDKSGSEGFVCTGAAAQLTLENSVAAFHGGAGVFASTGCTIRLSNCTIVHNAVGLQNYNNNAVVLSRVNNTIEDNGIPTGGAIGSYTPK
jgi:nitrous oxidase accessory protein NosD